MQSGTDDRLLSSVAQSAFERLEKRAYRARRIFDYAVAPIRSHAGRRAEESAPQSLAAANAVIEIVHGDVDQPDGRHAHVVAARVADAGDGLTLAGRMHAEILVAAHFHGD